MEDTTRNNNSDEYARTTRTLRSLSFEQAKQELGGSIRQHQSAITGGRILIMINNGEKTIGKIQKSMDLSSDKSTWAVELREPLDGSEPPFWFLCNTILGEEL